MKHHVWRVSRNILLSSRKPGTQTDSMIYFLRSTNLSRQYVFYSALPLSGRIHRALPSELRMEMEPTMANG